MRDYHIRSEKDVELYRAITEAPQRNFSCVVKNYKPNSRESKQARILFDHCRLERKQCASLEKMFMDAFIKAGATLKWDASTKASQEVTGDMEQEYLRGMGG